MKKLRLDLNYKTKPEELKAYPEPRLITENMVRAVVQNRYREGMNKTDMRIWADIMDKMHDGKNSIEIEKSSLYWLIDVFKWTMDNSKVPPLMASWINAFYSHLEQVEKNEETDLKAVK